MQSVTAHGNSICLVMIVRNEAAVIRRCLASAKSLITHWVICDTGSTDGTQAVIRETMQDVPGELFEDAWVDFGHNRTLSLDRAKGKADYHLLLDADMVLHSKSPLPDELTEDAYLIRHEGLLDYQIIRLVSDRHVWRYAGVTHEFIHSETACPAVPLLALSIQHHEDGGSRADKYHRDLRVLQDGVAKEPTNARYAFYLAQTYRDLGDAAHALDWYEKRVLMGGWEEETWCALYHVGKMHQALGADWRVVLNAYLQAYEFRPSRLEPLLPVARFYREHQQYRLGYMFSRAVTETPYPKDILFIERSVYEYELRTEFAICCYWLGLHEEASSVNQGILACPNLPENYRLSAERNLKLSRSALAEVRVHLPIEAGSCSQNQALPS